MKMKSGINSAGQTLEILEYVVLSGREVSLKEISEEIGLHISTVHRYLSTLINKGYLRKTHSGSYKPGFRILELSSYILQSFDLRDIARPYLIELMENTKQTVHLTIKDGYEGVYIDKVEGPGTLPMMSRVGMRMPLYSTSFGKVLLAYSPKEYVEDYLKKVPLIPRTENTITDPEKLKIELEKIRKQGYAFDDEENERGIKCIGAPVFDYTGNIGAAVSISGYYLSFEGENKEKLISELSKTCEKISSALRSKS
ncbi:MAG: IclR family transcriptional regulator [Dictyoglomaceae bacterium]|nr:IclR family transcriptional regulator [Dictyoglomaceae bacterium]HPU43451.1 IclR family transcriptional regulator [Dictyoglomaceae bacterium]